MSGQADYERIGRFIYAFHRLGASSEHLRALAASRQSPFAPDLRARAVQLADRFDALVKDGAVASASASDAELQAVLDEAAALCAAQGGAWNW